MTNTTRTVLLRDFTSEEWVSGPLNQRVIGVGRDLLGPVDDLADVNDEYIRAVVEMASVLVAGSTADGRAVAVATALGLPNADEFLY